MIARKWFGRRRNHTLMQTIARANRVMPGKEAGLIIDYVGVFKSLQKALAIYAPRPGEDGDEPIKDKTELVEALGQAIEQLVGWCEERGVDPNAIKTATGFDRVKLLDDAVEAIPEDDETKKAFLQHMQFGWFYGGHRALADCEACLALLAQSLPKSGRRVMAAVREAARKTDYLIRAVDAPYDMKDKLKQRGYRWRPAELQNGRVWWSTTDDPEAEIAWLRAEVYGQDATIPADLITARERYSDRIWSAN